jgi:hypothetical protein
MKNNIHLRDRLPRNRVFSLAPVIDVDPERPVTSSPVRQSFPQDSIKLSNKQSVMTPINSVEKRDFLRESKTTESKSFKNFFKPPQLFCNCSRIMLFSISFLLFCGAIAATITLLFLCVSIPSKESDYGEICSTKQCNQTKLLSCIDGICQCNDFEQQIFSRAINGCETKTIHERTHGEYCFIGVTKCLSNTNCHNSICQCNSTTQYWNGSNCLTKKTFNQTCTNRNTTNSSPYYLPSNCVDIKECTECSTESLLECNNVTKSCACTSSIYYFDNTLLKCMQVKSYNSYCTSNSECDSTIELYCPKNLVSVSDCPTTSSINRCDCQTGYYYDFELRKCHLKKGYYRPCTVDCECDSSKGFKCYNNFCSCKAYTTFNGGSCVSQSDYGTSCTNHIDCRGDLGLTCNNQTKCDCVNPSRYFWDSINKRCQEWYGVLIFLFFLL